MEAAAVASQAQRHLARAERSQRWRRALRLLLPCGVAQPCGRDGATGSAPWRGKAAHPHQGFHDIGVTYIVTPRRRSAGGADGISTQHHKRGRMGTVSDRVATEATCTAANMKRMCVAHFWRGRDRRYTLRSDRARVAGGGGHTRGSMPTHVLSSASSVRSHSSRSSA